MSMEFILLMNLNANKCLPYITYISGINATRECLKSGQIFNFLAFKFLISFEISCSFELSIIKAYNFGTRTDQSEL